LGLASNQKLIYVPYDPDPDKAVEDERFGLYYFTTRTFDSNKPTVLFIAGGPGIVRTVDDPLVQSLTSGYNIVNFHPRGSGFSQFPESNRYDRYLRIKFAVEDLEEIRKDLGINYWDAIVSHSAGTVIAQQYAGKYGPFGRVRKLVLSAPLSRHGIANPNEQPKCTNDARKCAAEELAKEIRQKHRENLEQIYRQGFMNLNGYQTAVLNEVETILDRVDEEFGNLPFVIDEYERLRNLRRRDLLKDHALDFSKSFFAALRQLRFLGWLPIDNLRTMQQAVGVIIARELACKMSTFSNWTGNIKTMNIDKTTGVQQETKISYNYCTTINALGKLMLSTPFSNELSLAVGRDRWTRDMKDTQLKVLRGISDNHFKELINYQDIILREVSNILDRVERQFGGLQFVIKNYSQLNLIPKQKPGQGAGLFGVSGHADLSELKKNSLDYDLSFFKALQSLLTISGPALKADPEEKRRQLSIGIIIVRELANTNVLLSKSTKKALSDFTKWEPVIGGEKISLPDAINTINNIDMSKPTRWARDMKENQLNLLSEIYSSNSGLDSLNEYEETIVKEAKRILDLVESKFDGCLDCVITNYNRQELQVELQNLALDFSNVSVYRALKGLLYINPSFLVSKSEASRHIGAIIGKEIGCRIATQLEALPEFSTGMLAKAVEINSYCDAAKSMFQVQENQSERVYYVVSTYDGLQIGFLKAWLATNRNSFREAVRKSAGTVHFQGCGELREWWWKLCLRPINQYAEKIGIVSEPIKPWDPADFSHEVTTLILEGSADPVTAGGQAEYIRDHALSGLRTFVSFPAIGHSMSVPQINTEDAPIGDTGPCLGAMRQAFVHTDILGCLIASFVEMDFEAFKRARILREIHIKFQSMLSETNETQNQNHRVRVFHCSGDFRSKAISAAGSNLANDPQGNWSKKSLCEEVSVFQ
jgi:pimeloyl-ACP methyl ester carboxylesterase